jgi:hypothetical protein
MLALHSTVEKAIPVARPVVGILQSVPLNVLFQVHCLVAVENILIVQLIMMLPLSLCGCTALCCVVCSKQSGHLVRRRGVGYEEASCLA